MEYKHAKDYLIELASAPTTHGWMHDLIVRLINKDGELNEEDYAAAAEQLINNSAATLDLPEVDTRETTADIKLVRLTHHAGVNALAAEQKVDFSKDITLLYGNNGSGKSSYFRILNEMVGGSREATIYPNIYVENNPDISVDLDFTVDGEPQSIHWSGNGERSVAPLNQACVFDSGYTGQLLEKRSADTALLHPMGLHLFNALTTAMETIKSMLGVEIDGIVRSLPVINQDNLQQDIRAVLTSHNYRDQQQKDIESRYEMTGEQQQELATCEAQLKRLTSTNYDDKIKLAVSERDFVEPLKNHIDSARKQLETAEKQLQENQIALQAAEVAAEEARQKIAILGEIGHTDTAEWRAFVADGDSFTKNSGIESGICPYCRQPLESHAKDILQAYADFLGDKTQRELKMQKETRTRLVKGVERLAVAFRYPPKLEQILGEENMACVKAELKRLSNWKARLLGQLVTETDAAVGKALGPCDLAGVLAVYDKQIEAFKIAKESQQQQIFALTTKMKRLLEHKAISGQKEQFKDWFQKMHIVHELERCQGETSTRGISTLSKIASKHLLTDSLKNKFQEELNALGLAGLEVSLNEMGVRSGQSYMQIKLSEDYRTQDILSEGEQKGIALALFIAERRMLQAKNPIILDDPVNSLDHIYTANFVRRLAQLGNQVIIFSHHILLKDSLVSLPGVHECSKDQIGSCGSHGQHLFLYRVRSRSRLEKGWICNSKKETVKNTLEEVQRKLHLEDFTDADSLSATALMRYAIEQMIDERVFKNLTPLKYRGGSQVTINWEKMKTLQGDAALIDRLHRCYNRLSGGDIHESSQRRENPIDLDTLMEVFNELRNINN